MADGTIDALAHESRTFAPPADIAQQANVTSADVDRARADRLAFWAEQAQRLTWDTPFDQVLDWSNAPEAKWFVGGRLNVAVNCVDRHVDAGHGQRVAFYFEGEAGDTTSLTYADLKDQVCRAANALTTMGITAGDRVAIYLPMIPEAVIAMLACARIGAVHSVVFGGFSATALSSRIHDAQARVVITADGADRRGKTLPLKPTVDAALADCPSVERVLVVRRAGNEIAWNAHDAWWHEALSAESVEHEPQFFDSEHPLFILYTSGTTGQPKGILHTTGGYLTQASWTHWAVFDLKADTDIYWCTADIGWITGHSYVTYGPLSNGATQLMYEGTPDTPHRGRWWELIEKYRVSIFYTAPTALRTFMKWGDEIPAQFDLSSLRILGSVGEPINPEAWMWYRETIGGNRCPIVDTWWQTETGAIMISPLPGVTATKPGSATAPLPGISAEVVDQSGQLAPDGSGGLLVLTEPWPSMLRGVWGDRQRFIDTYWARFEQQGYYFAGDGVTRDTDGYLWLLGRVDDVMKVSGHLLATAEVESALVAHPRVAEAAVVGASDPITGQGIVAFVILRDLGGDGPAPDAHTIGSELREHVAHTLGPIAKPRHIMVVSELPKTRSGKIMRRLLLDIAEHRSLGDTTTLADPAVVQLIADGMTTASED